MNKTKSIISKKSSSSIKSKSNLNPKTPFKSLIKGRLTFIQNRINLVNEKDASFVVNKGHGTSPVTLLAGREVYKESQNSKLALVENYIDKNGNVNDIKELFSNLPKEGLISFIADEQMNQDNEASV